MFARFTVYNGEFISLETVYSQSVESADVVFVKGANKRNLSSEKVNN